MEKMYLPKELENLKVYKKNKSTVFNSLRMVLVEEDKIVNYSSVANNINLNKESTSHKNNKSNSL